MIIIKIFLITILGLILGSFSTAITHRESQGLPWWKGARSACPKCGGTLGPADLLPVLSWLWLRGRCRYCREKISLVYPLTEISVLLACLVAYAFIGFHIILIPVLFAVPFLIALIRIDACDLILPNRLVAALAVLGLVYVGTLAQTQGEKILLAHGLGALLYAAFAWGLGRAMTGYLKKDALGFGDVKFFGVAGLWLGIAALPWFCLLSGFFGVVLGLVWQKAGRGSVFPFGPALIASFYVLLIVA